MQTERPVVSVVIGSYQRLDYLKSTVDTLRTELAEMAHEIIIVDGGSTDGTLQWLEQQKDVISIIQHNRGEWLGKTIKRRSWSYFMNLGFKIAQGTYICMLSDDCLVIPGALKNGCKLFDELLSKKKNIGAMAFYWRNWPEQEKYWVGKTFGNTMFVNHGLYLASAMQEIGFADEENFMFYHADGDICLRLAKAGYDIVDSPDSYIEHYSDANTAVRATNGGELQKTDWNTYIKRWGSLGEPDSDWLEKDFVDQHNTAEAYWGKQTLLKQLFKRG